LETLKSYFHFQIDTGNWQLTALNSAFSGFSSSLSNISTAISFSSNSSQCLILEEDGTSVRFVRGYSNTQADTTCSLYSIPLSFSSGSGQTNFVAINTTVENVIIEANNRLHNWTTSTGDVGLAYNSVQLTKPFLSSSANLRGLTGFQKLLLASLPLSINGSYEGTNQKTLNELTTFGLDFQRPTLVNESVATLDASSFRSYSTSNINQNTGITKLGNSTMQIGGISTAYADSIVWQAQPKSSPQYHEFFVQDLSFCGRNIMHSSVTHWPAMVDTGSVCLSLPTEIYDSFLAWLNTDEDLLSTDDLPDFTFSYSDLSPPSSSSGTGTTGLRSSEFSIPLSSLVLNATVFHGESGAPSVTIAGEKYRLCILSSGVYHKSGSATYTSPR
jgi:hypothetical protein